MAKKKQKEMSNDPDREFDTSSAVKLDSESGLLLDENGNPLTADAEEFVDPLAATDSAPLDVPVETDDARIQRTVTPAMDVEALRHIPSETEQQATAGKVTGNRQADVPPQPTTLEMPSGPNAFRPRE